MVLPFFALTLFVSAFCLFLVQPIIGKLILPKLGGTPQVWNTCMVFFQTALLAGYGYTHTVSTRLKLRQQLITHGILLFIPLLILLPSPVAFPGSTGPFSFPNWTPPLGGNPIPQALLLLSWIVGIPFLVVATSAPLLQKWFSNTGHPAAKDPYFLYGASNLGSLLALLLYPVAVEPWFNLSTQAWLFFTGYCILLTLVLGCIGLVWESSAAKLSLVDPPHPEPSPAGPMPVSPAAPPAPPAPSSTATTAVPPPPSPSAVPTPPAPAAPKFTPAAAAATAVKKGPPRPGTKQPGKPGHVAEVSIKKDEMTNLRRLRWICLAAVPSSFMLGVTSHITTDLSPMPLFWLVPLSLYLLSFILVFSKWPTVWVEKPHQVVLYVQAIAIAVMIWCEYVLGADSGSEYLWTIVFFNVFAFFATALMCHGELAKDRPGTQHLTEYFLLMSVGGMVGGMFNGLVAPVFFWGLAEFPIAVFLACLVRPMMKEEGWIDSFLANLLEPQHAPKTPAKGAKAGQPQPALEKTTSYAPLLDVALPLVVVGLGFLLITMIPIPTSRSRGQSSILANRVFGYGVPLAIACFYLGRQYRFALAIGGALLIQVLYEGRQEGRTIIVHDRSYFGIIRVKKSEQPVETPDKGIMSFQYTQLVHGHILHGQNFMIPEKVEERGSRTRDFSRLATTYYHRRGPAGVVMEEFNWFSSTKNFLPANDFSSDARICASMVGINAMVGGILPIETIVDGWSEPPFATIGLGTGTMASYGRPFQYVHYYEIDDHIKRLSEPGPKDKKLVSSMEGFPEGVPYFNYLFMAKKRGCNVEVLMGDARLRMALPYNLVELTTTKGNHYRGVIKEQDDKEIVLVDLRKNETRIAKADIKEGSLKRDKNFAGGPDDFYHMMVVDAFSSDAIPAHLITRQAIELYFTKLTKKGILCVHTSNRFVNLPKVVAAVSQDLGFAYKTGHDRGFDIPSSGGGGEDKDFSIKNVGRSSSEWVMVGRTADDLKSLQKPEGYDETDSPYWRVYPPAEERYLWTDDHYNLLTILRIFDKSSR